MKGGFQMRFFLAFLCTCLFLASDVFAAHWGKTGKNASLAVGATMAVLAIVAFGWLNKYWPLAQSVVFVNVAIVTGAVFVGYFFFEEELTRVQWGGVVVGLVAIVMLIAGGK